MNEQVNLDYEIIYNNVFLIIKERFHLHYFTNRIFAYAITVQRPRYSGIHSVLMTFLHKLDINGYFLHSFVSLNMVNEINRNNPHLHEYCLIGNNCVVRNIIVLLNCHCILSSSYSKTKILTNQNKYVVIYY